MTCSPPANSGKRPRSKGWKSMGKNANKKVNRGLRGPAGPPGPAGQPGKAGSEGQAGAVGKLGLVVPLDTAENGAHRGHPGLLHLTPLCNGSD